MSMQKIEHYEVTNPSGETSITFNSIPDTYTDLYLVLSLRSGTTGVTTATVDLNSTAPATSCYLRSNGSAASSATATELLFNASTTTANTFSNISVYIPNYTSSVAKSGSVDQIVENNTAATSVYQYIYAQLWNVTSAVTSITITDDYSQFVQYSSATLYGITAGSDGTTVVS